MSVLILALLKLLERGYGELNIPILILSTPQVKKYDLEVWMPSQKKYKETGSSSYFHDFQTRRLNIRYRDDDGKLRFVHSLNNTAIATPRFLLMIIENYQNEDGTITIPEALRPYMEGKEKIGKAVFN